MSVLTINTDADPLYYDQTVQLEGREFVFGFQWSARELCWYLSISDQDETPLATSIRLVVNWPLLRKYTDPRLPPGRLIAIDLSDQMQDIQVPGDLGTRVSLTYYTSDDPGVALVDALAA